MLVDLLFSRQQQVNQSSDILNINDTIAINISSQRIFSRCGICSSTGFFIANQIVNQPSQVLNVEGAITIDITFNHLGNLLGRSNVQIDGAQPSMSSMPSMLSQALLASI